MPFLDTNNLPVIERLPGWHGRYFHSRNMTFAHYDFARGSSIHEHFHPEEEVYEVIEGELEVTIDGVAQIAKAGLRCDHTGERPSLRQGSHRWQGRHRRLSGEARFRLGTVGQAIVPAAGFQPARHLTAAAELFLPDFA